MKFFDCSACIGLDVTNKKIVNHENYFVYEKVKQAANAAELLAAMDFCGIDEAVVFHQSMIDKAPAYGNEVLLKEKQNFFGRLKGSMTILPSICDDKFSVENVFKKMKKNALAALRAYPQNNRYFLDRITCGDILDAITENKIPLYLSPSDGWKEIFDCLKEFPALTVIITNYGLWGSDRYFYPLIKAYKNVYIDTSDYQVVNGLEAFVAKFGSERLLFGSNYPANNFGGPKAVLLGAKIPQRDKENIAYLNLEGLLKGAVL